MPNRFKDPTQPGASDASIDSLNFERAETSTNTTPVCAQCATPITDRYYTIGSHVLCEPCHFAFQNAKAPGNAATRFFGAAGLGALAAALGCGLWMVVTKLTGYEIGLIAIAVGYLVGMAVQFGSHRVGGLVYQLLAAFLTYTAIVMTYVPIILSDVQGRENFESGFNEAYSEPEADSEITDPAADTAEGESSTTAPAEEEEVMESAWIIGAILLAYALPFLAGFENAIGILIIGIALWQAFRMNARAKIELQGPFRLEARDTAVG
ncbi:MAG: hypothetical protein JRE57_14080 [Deltaproteobacteria bacterium]|nr:hypothetical protein [Deltaproteobacteria bacterium]